VTRRHELTQGIINLLPQEQQVSVDKAIKFWYYNIRSTGGFRLTELGFKILSEANIECWNVNLDSPKLVITKSVLLQLDHKIKFPYYIDSKHKKIVLFSSREAMLATLYGDLQQFLKHYSG
jgi:hypothetical protein